MSSSTLFIAVECCQCSTMQVKQQKKSSNKWTCVVCNQKQSVRKVFSQSYMAKDIRQFVQSRNMARKFADEQALSLEGEELTQVEPIVMLPASSSCIRSESKRRTDWSEYLDPAEDHPEQDETVEEGEVEVITEMPPKRAKLRNGGRMLDQMKQTNKKEEQVKDSEGRSLKYEASKLGEANRSGSNLLCNKEEEMACQLPTAAATTTAKASKWDDYITNDEDEW